MHGLEGYQVAAHMVQEGVIEEGTHLMRAVHWRYNGEFRNPWNELECGSNYARSMASFSLLPSLTGMPVDMGEKLSLFLRCALERFPAYGRWTACLVR